VPGDREGAPDQHALVLRGKKGAGKTRLLYQLMDLFAGVGFSVANFTLEIRKGSDLVARMTEEYISLENRAFIQTADTAPEGVATIRQAAAHFDVVAIDSWSKLGVKQEEFDRLRNDFPNTFFLVIFQSTTADTARGGSMAEYDAGTVVQVEEGGVAICEKNRYGGEDLQYQVFDRQLERNY
jgi:hypothetical protein